LMFKGSKNYPPKSFSLIVQRNGGIDNAFTTKDYTMYYETMPSDRLSLAIKMEADRMKNLLLKEEDILTERQVVMEERRLRYEDDPESLLYEEVKAAAFKVHPYHNPVIGWMSHLKGITPEDLRAHYRKYYCKDNAFVVVAGDVLPQEIKRQIEEAFSGAPSCEPHDEYVPEEPPQQGQRRVYLKKEAKLPYLLMAFKVPSFPHEDSMALEALAGVLNGKSGRLYRSLVREKQIALEVFASYDSLSRDGFLFFIGGTPKSGVSPEELEKALWEEIRRIKQHPPQERELQKVINQTESSFLMGQDSIFFQAELVGMFQVLGNWRLMDRYLEDLRKVHPEDVQKVANKYLIKEHVTVGVLEPVEAK
ncbi:MAG: insulinase family protein, partial [Nitrospirae bacterium]